MKPTVCFQSHLELRVPFETRTFHVRMTGSHRTVAIMERESTVGISAGPLASKITTCTITAAKALWPVSLVVGLKWTNWTSESNY